MNDSVLQPSWFDSKPRPALKSKSAYNQCKNCKLRFAKLQIGNTSLKHHCRVCGEMFCKACTTKQTLPSHLWKRTGVQELQSTCCFGCYDEALSRRANSTNDPLSKQTNKEVIDGKVNVFVPAMQHDAKNCAQCRRVLDAKKTANPTVYSALTVDNSGGMIGTKNNCLLCGRLFCKNCIYKTQFQALPKEFKTIAVHGGYGICGTCKFQAPGSVFKALPRPETKVDTPKPRSSDTSRSSVDPRIVESKSRPSLEHRKSEENNLNALNTRYAQPYGYGVTLQQLKKETCCVVHGCREKRHDGGFCASHQTLRPDGGAPPTVVFHTQPVVEKKGPSPEEQLLLGLLPKSDFIVELELQSDLEQFVKLLQIANVKKGEKVYSEHQLGGKDMFFLVKGSLFAFYNDLPEGPEKPKRVKIGNPLVPGNSFGELGLVCEALPRCHSVVAAEPVVVASLDRDVFLDFLNSHPTPAVNYHKFKCRIMERLFKCFGVHFFDILPSSHFGELGDVIDVSLLQPNETLTKEGDSLTFTYVLSGELAVGADTRVSPGQYFGEMGLVVLGCSPVSVMAVEPTIVLQVRGDEFASLFKGAMEQYAGLAIQIAQQDTPLPTILFHPMGRSYFTEFMEKIKAEQHVSFFLECSQFNDTAFGSSEQALPAARNLANRFFSPASKEQINTRAVVRSAVLQDVESKNVKASTFLLAFSEVMELLAADYFPEFKELESFAKFLKAVGKNAKSQEGVVVCPNFLLHGKKHDPFVVERDRLKEQTRAR